MIQSSLILIQINKWLKTFSRVNRACIFDKRIILAAENLYDRFGLQNGKDVLEGYFSKIEIQAYEDEIVINQAEPLIEYILSCHGNQNQYLLERYHEFRVFVEKQVKKEYHITKDAGYFFCKL